MEGNRPGAGPPAGRQARALVRAWALSTAAVASLAALWVVSTQLRVVRAHSPWADDPYDAVISVSTLVLPFVWTLTTARLLRWRVAAATPPAAVRTIVRGLVVVLALVWAAVLACVTALAVHAGGAARGPWPGWLRGLVALTCLAAIVASVDLATTSRRLGSLGPATGSGWRGAQTEPDALDDISALLDAGGRLLARSSRRLGRLLSSGAAAVAAVASSRWGPRRHRVAWCLALALGFGAALATWHGIAEGASAHWSTQLLVGAVFASAGAAIVVVSYACLGTYLRLIRPEPRPDRR